MAEKQSVSIVKYESENIALSQETCCYKQNNTFLEKKLSLIILEI